MSVVSAQNNNAVCCCPCHVGLIKNIEPCCSCWVIWHKGYTADHLYNGIEKCFERIERLEQSRDKMSDNNKDIYEKLNKFQERHTRQIDENRKVSRCIEELEDQIKILTNMYKELSIKHVKLIDYELNKKPYKCPVCEGKILSEIKITRTESGRDKLILECHACDGKGIVWG